MNLEEIKAVWAEEGRNLWPQEIEWLITEVERLSDELNTEKFRTCERCAEKTATRCAEIAEPRDKHVARMIRKEFDLES